MLAQIREAADISHNAFIVGDNNLRESAGVDAAQFSLERDSGVVGGNYVNVFVWGVFLFDSSLCCGAG